MPLFLAGTGTRGSLSLVAFVRVGDIFSRASGASGICRGRVELWACPAADAWPIRGASDVIGDSDRVKDVDIMGRLRDQRGGWRLAGAGGSSIDAWEPL